MATAARSLRSMVEYWLYPALGNTVHIAEFGKNGNGFGRYVCVEVVKPAGIVSMYFFRHRDGRWRVFPAEVERPVMRVEGC
jgi:hypothetical protein